MDYDYSDIFDGDDNQENSFTNHDHSTIISAYSSRNECMFHNDRVLDPPSKICGGTVLSRIMSLSNNSSKKKRERKKKQRFFFHQKSQRPSVTKVTIPLTPPIASYRFNCNNNKNILSSSDLSLSPPTNDKTLTGTKINQEESRQYEDCNVERTKEEEQENTECIVEQKIHSKNSSDNSISSNSTTGDNIGSQHPSSHSGMSSLKDMQNLLEDLKALGTKVKEDTESKLGRNRVAITIDRKISPRTTTTDSYRKETLDDPQLDKKTISSILSLRVDRNDNYEERKNRRLKIEEEKNTVHCDNSNEINDQIIRRLKMDRKYYRREANDLRQEVDSIKKELEQMRKNYPEVDRFERITTGIGNDDDNWLELLDEPVKNELERAILAQGNLLSNYAASCRREEKSIEEFVLKEALGQRDTISYQRPVNDQNNDNQSNNPVQNQLERTILAQGNLFPNDIASCRREEKSIDTVNYQPSINDQNIDNKRNNPVQNELERTILAQGNTLSNNVASCRREEKPIEEYLLEEARDQHDTVTYQPHINDNNLFYSAVAAEDNRDLHQHYEQNSTSLEQPIPIYVHQDENCGSSVQNSFSSPIDTRQIDNSNISSANKNIALTTVNSINEYHGSLRSEYLSINDPPGRFSGDIDSQMDPTPKSKQTSSYCEDRLDMSKKLRRYWQNKTKNTVINSSNSSLQVKIDALPQDHVIMEKCDSENVVNVYEDPENKLKICRQYCQNQDDKLSNSSNSSLLLNSASLTQGSKITDKCDNENAMTADNDRGNVFKDYRQYRHSQRKKNTEANPNGPSHSHSTNVASVVTKKCYIKNAVKFDKNTGDMPKGYKYKKSKISSPFTNFVYTEDDAMMETFDFENTASFYRECGQLRLEHRGNLSPVNSDNTTNDLFTTKRSEQVLRKCDMENVFLVIARFRY